jgi:hypothetical protein
MQVFSSDDGYDTGNLPLGILAGAIGALLAALAWAAITAATNFQIGFMAIGVGIVVAYAVRRFGHGHDGTFAIASGVLSLLGCLAGNFLAVVFSVAAHDHVPYLTVFVGLVPHIVDVFQQTFNFMDLIFYAIGIYYGYRYATVPLRARTAVVPEQTP